ncbi:MAG: PilZ domain-containing protein [Nitrospiraceae bacterium]|nr:MAG: PilZ domain-containing protein [Nitrospiraceae bacterium]
MDNRFYKRTQVQLNARIITEGKEFDGSIENVSEGGIGYLINSSIKDSTDFSPRKMIEVDFLTSAGEKIRLECEIVWFSRSPAGDNELTLGMKIVNPPPEYKEWMSNLSGNSIIKKIK